MIVYDTTLPVPSKYKYEPPKQRKPIRNPVIGTIGLILAIFIIPIIAGIVTTDTTATETSPEEWAEIEEVEHKADIKEQKYIVRYATAFDIDEQGITTYIDQNGNEWKAIDAPTEIGNVARLLFDSKETISPYDDEIIDITM